MITTEDIGFFLSVGVFWYLIGTVLDARQRVGLAVLSCGFLCGIAAGVYAIALMATRYLPWKQIGACGAVWSVVLIGYFGFRLTGELRRRHDKARPSTGGSQ